MLISKMALIINLAIKISMMIKSIHLIRQVRRQPAFDFADGYVLAPRVVFDLVLGDEIDGEIAGFRMTEIEAADRGSGEHGEAFRQFHTSGLFNTEQVPEGALFSVV